MSRNSLLETGAICEVYVTPKGLTSKNIFMYIKTHYGETILAKIRKLEKTMIKYSSYTNHLRFFLRCHHNKILPKDLQLKSRIKTERSKIRAVAARADTYQSCHT